MGLLNWIRRKRLREGRLLVIWPAMDLREDRLVCDLSRLDQDLVGVRRRRYGVLNRTLPPPNYPESIEYLTVTQTFSFRTHHRETTKAQQDV